MTQILDSNATELEIVKITDSVYKIIFRENFTEVTSDKISCDEYVIYTDTNNISDDLTIEEYVEQNKEVLLASAKEQDKIKLDKSKINNMKSSLDNSDYRVIKSFENYMIGIPFDEDLSAVFANRQMIRDTINNIENSITDEDNLISQVKQRKINEVSLISQSVIINGVEFNGKQYRLNTTDQINISALNMMAQAGHKVPYHADGEVCRIFEPEEMILLAQTSTAWIVYHTTYFNLLKHQILDYTTIEEVEAVYYGMQLKEEYQQIVDTITSMSSNGGEINEEA